MHSPAVDPRKLLLRLMSQAKLNPNSLSVRTRGRTKQPTIYRYITGEAKEPKRSTLLPVAEVFGVPVEAFFDPKVADDVARERGLLGQAPEPDAAPMLSIADAAEGSGAALLQAEAQVRAILEDDAVRQLLIDLADLPPARRSQILDMVHGYAEDARAAHEHLMQRKAPVAPTPSAAANRSSGKAHRSVRIRIGDGNPDQGSLELRLLDDPFTAEPDQRERELYHRLAKAKTHRQ